MEIESFIDSWLKNPKWWFSPTYEYDDLISNKYGYLLDIVHDIVHESNLHNFIIIYDQLPRHIFRNYGNHIIDYYLQKALKILDDNFEKIVQENHGDLLCFLLLPYRHSKDVVKIFKVIDAIWNKIVVVKDVKICESYKRFLKASYQRCPFSPGKIYNFDGSVNITNSIEIRLGDKYRNILDYCGKNEITYKHFDGVTGFDISKKYIISLSGGVDSMVCSWIFKNMLNCLGCRERIIMVHINYCNRDTSNKEEMFVKDWVNYLGIKLYVMRIDEINRPKCMEYDMRELYESYTKNIRMESYKDAINYMGWDINEVCVVLGHNRDDCFENIMTNITSGGKYENLYGMETTSENNGLNFIRPMLGITKSDIINYAVECGIPYLYDSTPKWSQRGKIRDNVVPCLDSWNKQCIPGLFQLSEHLKDMHSIIDEMVNNMIISYDSNKVLIRFSTSLLKPMIWRTLFKIIKFPQPSNKSLSTLINRIQESNTKIYAFLRKDMTVLIKHDVVDISYNKING